MILKPKLNFLTNMKYFNKATFSSMIKNSNQIPSILLCYSTHRIVTSDNLLFKSIRNLKTNSFSLLDRTHTCGELRSTHVGQKVRISGWLQFQRGGVFITLRDAYGNIQCIIPKVSFVFILINIFITRAFFKLICI